MKLPVVVCMFLFMATSSLAADSCKMRKIDRWGTWFAKIPRVKSKTECAHLCSNNARCLVWVYGVKKSPSYSETCLLKEYQFPEFPSPHPEERPYLWSGVSAKDTLQDACCSVGGIWWKKQNTCLRYYPHKYNWDQANIKCSRSAPKGFRGRLLMFPNFASYKFFSSTPMYRWARPRRTSLWIGLRARVRVVNKWKILRSEWAFMEGGAKLTVAAKWNYIPGHLRNACPGYKRSCQVPQCMELYYDSVRTQTTVPCTKKNHAICEFVPTVQGKSKEKSKGKSREIALGRRQCHINCDTSWKRGGSGSSAKSKSSSKSK